MTFPFGQDFTYSYYPLVNELPATIGTWAKTQTPSIYVFTTLPSEDAAKAGTGALGVEIIAWTWSATTNGWSFTVPAINGPQPSSVQTRYPYFIAINFRLQASAQIQTVIRSLEMERITGHFTTVTVTDTDLTNAYAEILSFTTPEKRAGYTTEALLEVTTYLSSKGFDWSKVHRPEQLNFATKLNTIKVIMLSESQNPNDKFWLKYLAFKERYETAIANVKLEYDQYNQSTNVVQETAGATIFLTR